MILPAVVCCLAFGLLSPFAIIPLLRGRGVVDIPNERSSHTITTVRGGGICVCIAFGTGVLCFYVILVKLHYPGPAPMSLIAAIVAVIGAGAIGLAEDLHGLSVLHRLVLQGVLVTAVAVMLTSDSDGTALVLVLASFSGVFYVNASNFMDGINGLSAAQGILVGVYFAALGVGRGDTYAFTVGIMMAASCTAFVPWNFPTARMFLGDVGSYALGAGAWALAVWSVVAGASPTVAVAPFTILVVDVVWTLLDRARHRRPLTSPHRQHIYQQLATITSHGYATSLVAGFTLVCASAGALHAYDRLPKVALILVLVVMSILYVCAAVPVTDVLVDKLERKRKRAQGRR